MLVRYSLMFLLWDHQLISILQVPQSRRYLWAYQLPSVKTDKINHHQQTEVLQTEALSMCLGAHHLNQVYLWVRHLLKTWP